MPDYAERVAAALFAVPGARRVPAVPEAAAEAVDRRRERRGLPTDEFAAPPVAAFRVHS